MSKLNILKVRQEHEVNGYVVACAATKEAIVVDPGAPSEKMLDQLNGLKVRFVVISHGHPGHVAGKDAVAEKTDATTAMHIADAKQFLRSATMYVTDGDELEFGEFKASVIHTPGHTPGSICLLVGNHLFTGDTLIPGGVGKPGPEADLRRQMMSIGTKLLTLPPATAIYPGHGPATTLAAEYQTNPIFRRQPV
ncbi:MAG TPA: MBL fold metallo-hydrolase [Candidatus Dormibacteraeota bacterium]|jgi:glyoxylase-like metal-dependent hydrolase (beta-lactamase superfamily II)|nr:MBL fold metallo-hydrolase [Candidatus Dormibacteraeota bacterium]